MTKTHFEAIASIIEGNVEISDHVIEEAAIAGVAKDLADYFLTVNPRFDRKRFLAACGL